MLDFGLKILVFDWNAWKSLVLLVRSIDCVAFKINEFSPNKSARHLGVLCLILTDGNTWDL